MDLENLNCPQFVRFSSESFLASTMNYDVSSDEMDNSNQLSSPYKDSLEENSSYEQTMNSLTESQLSEEQHDRMSVSSEEQFVIQTRASRSQAAALKKQATVPKPFHFQTDARVKDLGVEAGTTMNVKDFSSQLRQHSAQSTAVASGVTKVKPFNLTESKVKKGEGTYLSLAEQIKAFQNKTPERFHSSTQKEFQTQENWCPPKLTRARTPKLQAIKRSRPVEVLSREEEEEKEIEEMKKFEFHAQPVDPRIYKPQIIEKPVVKKTTKINNVELQTAKRAKSENSLVQAENTYQFRARKIPKNILKGPVGLGEKPEIPKTVPKTPNFKSEKRLAKRKLAEQESEAKEAEAKRLKKEVVVKKKKPAPKKPQKPKRTTVKPFTFDEKDKERFLRKELKIQEEIEKAQKPFEFKAQEMPINDKPILPNVEKKKITQPKPFNFILDQRKLSTSVNFGSDKENHSFKARPATVLHKPAFVPERSHKSFTEIQEFTLQTDRRASERLKLQQEKEIQELENIKILEKQKALEEKKERLEILKLRQETVHKANPIPEYKPLEIKRSTKPVTAPMSPKFETDKRLRSRNETFRQV